MLKNKKTFMSKIKKMCILIFIAIIGINLNVKASDETIVSSEKWKEWQNEEYWEWHTRTTSDDKAYNGKHIVIKNDIINFYGYWKNSYKDFLYKSYKNAGKKTFKFRMDETKANYHTLDGAGFIFNSNIVDNKFSGYILLFRQKDICLYRLDNIDVTTFENTPSTTIATYGKLIKSIDKTNSSIHDLQVEATPTRIKVMESEKEILNIDLDYSIHSGESFGLIASYVQHACNILSTIEFSQLEIEVKDYKIEAINTDMDNNPINGGYFQIKNEKGKIVAEGKTISNGKFEVGNITSGNYTIQQIKAPDGYILNDEIYKFNVTEDGNIIDVNTKKEIKLEIKNEKYKIEVSNNIFNTSTPIPGSIIGLYDENGKEISKQTTDKNGKVVFSGINPGKYKYKQIEVPDGYVLNTTEYDCVLKEDSTVEFKNDEGIVYNQKENNKQDEKNSLINNTINKEDNTISKLEIPKAGKEKLIKIIISIAMCTAIFLFIMIRKYKIIR